MIQIRPYKKSDYQAVLNILQKSGLYYDSWNSETNLSSMTGSKYGSILLAVEGNKVVGNIFIIPFGSEVIFLFGLAVKEEYRNKGIATKLIESAQKVLPSVKGKEIGLFVDANNPELQDFYKKRNFTSSYKHWIYMWKELK